LKRFEGKNYGYYVIIPNMIGEDKKKDAKRTFYLRIFSSDPVEVAEMPETVETVEEG
jgi:calpain, invertebrate